MAGDGNCLFRSLAHPHMDHTAVRARVASHIEGAWERHFRHFLTDEEQRTYREDMRRTGIWGDELSLSAFADAYRRRVVVHDRDTLRVLRTYGSDGDDAVHLAFSGCHYDALVCQNAKPRRT